MKIVSQNDSSLVASDKQFQALLVGIVFAVVGIGIAIGGLAKHTVIADLIGAVVLIVGLLILVFRKERTLTVDKGAGKIEFNLVSIIKKANREYAVQDVVKLQLITQFQTQTMNNPGQGGGLTIGGGNTQTTERTKLLLQFKDGTFIDLADGQHSMQLMGVFGSVPNEGVGQKIAAFIGIPFEQVGPESLGQVVSTIADAIKGRNDPPKVS